MANNWARKMEKVGNYYYTMRRNQFWVFEYVSVWENGCHGHKVAEFDDINDARNLVWQHNGWGMPKTALSK